ncbi:MAG: hypothetical protein KA981_10255 [Bacteroidia bacterium]|nr:hypothetical protein [Bacteroidia bacterium]
MAQDYTENDLILYLYKELNEAETKELESALLVNPQLQTLFNNLKAGMAVLNQLEAEPSQTSIDLILEYSQKSAAKLEEV